MLFKRKKRYSMPEGAVISMRRGTKNAQWTDNKGRKRQAPVTSDGRIEVELATYTARYRNAAGERVERPTGCRSRDAAQTRLNEWLREAERVRAGVLSRSEASVAEWSNVPLLKHVEEYKSYMRALVSQRFCYNKPNALILQASEAIMRFMDLKPAHFLIFLFVSIAM